MSYSCCRFLVPPILVLPALLSALIPAPVAHAQKFQIGTLSADACQAVSHYFITGGDRGPIAVGAEHVLYTGADGVGRFDLEDLGNPASLPEVFYDTLTSNLRTGQIFTFAFGETSMPLVTGTAKALLEIDAISGRLSGSSIPLSRPVQLRSPAGFFAGWNRAAIHSGEMVYDIDLRTGRVRVHGPLALSEARLCEIGAFWGVAEFFDGSLHLVYRGAADRIVRTRVDDATTTILAQHDLLGNMCAFSVAPAKNRWYFHHENFSQFALGNQVLGFCTATAGTGPRAELTLHLGELPEAPTVGTAFALELTVRNDGPGRAKGTRFETRLPATVQVLSAIPSRGRCQPGCRNLVCE